ncbi:hypothetical protein Tco_0243516 [Tanacetum coccineum]
MTHPHPKGNFVPKAVLTKSGIKTLNTAGQNFSKAAVSVNTVKPVNTAYPRPTVNSVLLNADVFNSSFDFFWPPVVWRLRRRKEQLVSPDVVRLLLL